MPVIDVVAETPVHDSFRVAQVAGLFDMPLIGRSRVEYHVELPDLEEPWTIGAIVGPSGSGKSTVARRAFGDALVDRYDWPADRAVVDGFDAQLDGRTITGMLNSEGFSSPPAWVRPWSALSNGERFRCDLARALLTEAPLVGFDEFTSVVDRQVARFGSAAVAKAIRAGRARCKRFVAVTCHYDVLEWLEPDWWLDMATCQMARRWLQPIASGGASGGGGRPAVSVDIRRCKRTLWTLFSRHHYLSGKLHPGAWCYAALWNDEPIGFCATIPLFGGKSRRIVHRLVVLPDYQGLGVGLALLGAVAAEESAFYGVSIVTSHPALVRALARHRNWRCVRVQPCGRPHRAGLRNGRRVGSVGRATASFRFLGVPI